MAGGFLEKWFGRSEVPPAVAEALRDLKQLAAERPSLSSHAGLVAKVLTVLYRRGPAEPPPTMPREHAAAKLVGGIPLLQGERIELNGTALAERWSGTCAARGVGATYRADRVRPDELARAVLAGRPEAAREQAEALDLDAAVVGTLLRWSLFPVLARWNGELARLRQGIAWQRGDCPTCGSWPLVGEFRGLEQVRWLRCGLCAAEWEFPRLACPFCGIRDHRQLGYFHVEGEEGRYRAATCAECRGYLKMIATLTPLTAPGLFVTDLATLHLDLVAAGRGYLAAQ